MNNISWDALKAFMQVAERGSLTDAADDLGISVATLARRMNALESALGAALLRRGPQGASPTAQGEQVLALVRQGADHLNQLDRLSRSMAADAINPPIRISSTEPMIADVLAPAIPQLTAQHPNLIIELEVSLELSNLNRGEADIAIRMVKPSGDTLITRRLPTIRMGLFASKAYLGARAANTIDLKQERLLWYDSAYGPIAENVWLKRQQLEGQVVMRTGSVQALSRAAEVGTGIAPIPAYIGKRMQLIELTQINFPDRTPWLVFHRDAKMDKRQKIVRDWIVAASSVVISPQ